MTSNGFDVPQVGNRPSNVQKEFKRAYMACIRCRSTKAKCEVGNDSAACVKCARERRNCVFTSERSNKKRKIDSQAEAIAQDPRSDRHHTQSRNSSHAEEQDSYVTPDTNTPGSAPSGSELRDLRPKEYDDGVVQTVVSSSKDALGLLFQAAEEEDTDDSEDPIVISGAPDHTSPTSTMAHHPGITPSRLSRPSREVVDLWEEFSFVRQGWFSATEAVTYIDLYFRNLSNLTPLLDTRFTDHRNHRQLILQEPLLCCVLLVISSRYHVLPGPGGASRAELIHLRLWKHAECMVKRLTFAQEPYLAAKTRTLSTIQALLLLTEWHPRTLHVPPEHDGWDASLAPSLDRDYRKAHRIDDANVARWHGEVLEPAKRSDRMSWMLLGIATTLAHELGVFDEFVAETHNTGYPDARLRIRRLLFLYVSQVSLRIGCTSLLPQISSSLSPPSETHQIQEHRDRDALVSAWIEITKIRKTTTELFFPNSSTTRQLMTSGRYQSLLEHFHPLLAQWHDSFSRLELPTLPESSKQMVFLDFFYVRMYTNSIAMQAMVEREKLKDPSVKLVNDLLSMDNQQDWRFIEEVVDASRNILVIAVSLADADVLKYCPVRVFISITAASIFLLKAMGLGTKYSNLQKSLDVLDQCIRALRYGTHDDMHLSSKYGTLLARHVRRFRRNFRVKSSVTHPVTPNGHQTQPSSAFKPLQSVSNTASRHPLSTANPSASYESIDIDAGMDDWLEQPFDPSFAPFTMDINQPATGLEMNSLDFLWNLGT